MKKGKDHILKSKKIEARKRQKRIRIGVYLFALVLIILVVPPLFVRIPFFSIKHINVEGTKTVDPTTVSELSTQYLNGSFLKFFPRATFLTAGKSKLKETILKTFPLIYDAKLSFHTPNTLLIEIQEREPFVLWCSGQDYKKCFFADKSAFLYDIAPEFSSPVYTVYRGGSDTDNPIGQKITDDNIFKRLNDLEKEFSILGLKTKEVVFQPNEDIYFNLSHGSLYVSLREDDKLTLNNLTSLLSNPKTDLSDGLGGIKNSYIDLRFGNKIFYK